MEHVTDGCSCEGKKCTKCGQLLCIRNYTKDKRLKSGLNSGCRKCESIDNKKWRENNREYNYQRKREWNEANADHVTSLRKQRHFREYIRTTNRRSPSHNRTTEELREMERESNQKQYHKNKQANYERVTRYCNEHPGYRATIEANRRARKREAGGSHTYQEWEELKAKYNYTCLCCGRREPEIQLHADHVISVFNGGTTTIENIQPLCKSCNSSKGRKTHDFRPPNS